VTNNTANMSSAPPRTGRVHGVAVAAKDFWKEHMPLSLQKFFPFHFTTCHRLEGDGREPGSAFRATSTMGVEIRVEITAKDDHSVSWSESVGGSKALWHLQTPGVPSTSASAGASEEPTSSSCDVMLGCGWEGDAEGDCSAYPASATLDVELRRRLADLRVSQGAAHPKTITIRFFEEAEAVTPSAELEPLRELAHAARAAFDQRTAALTGEAKEKHDKLMSKMPAMMPEELICEVFDASACSFVHHPQTELRPGDLLQITSGDYIPADCLLLWSTSPLETAVQVAAVDGDNSLRLRQVVDLPLLPGADTVAAAREHGLFLALSAESAAMLSASGAFELPPPLAAEGRFKAVFRPSGDYTPVTLEYRQFLPAGSRMVMTERAMALVLRTGLTVPQLSGGELLRPIRFAAREELKEVKKRLDEAKREEREMERARPRDAAELAAETGVEWETGFTNVPDDGNCMMHAFWLGLKTLLNHYPHLRLEDEPPLPDDPEAFRVRALEAMCASEHLGYVAAVENQLRLWLELDPALLMTAVEDFFTLPPEFQSKVASLNQSVQLGGFEDVDFAGLVHEYIEVLKTRQDVDGRAVFVPLGQLELEMLLSMYQVRLQIIKSEALRSMHKWRRKMEAKAKAETEANDGSGAGSGSGGATGEAEKEPSMDDLIRETDPRTIQPAHVMDRQPTAGCNRVVRIMNVSSNHYQVHLPAPPREAAVAASGGV